MLAELEELEKEFTDKAFAAKRVSYRDLAKIVRLMRAIVRNA